MPTPTVGRYAPSPTGFLHLGNLRTALVAWLAARLAGGRFLLRIEDIDTPRVIPGCADQQLRDLEWLGLDWDEPPLVQSQRGDIYEDALLELERGGHIFWCTCSRKDISEAASAPHGPAGPVYPGTCRRARPDEQRRHPLGAAARLAVPDPPRSRRSFHDEVLGTVEGDLLEQGGDFVVRRRDGIWAYQLACAVDDALTGVTQVVRGADLVESTHKQLYLQSLLRLDPPREWWHVPLMLDQEGRRLAKRDPSDSLEARRAAGATPEQIVGELAASLGLVPPGERVSAEKLLLKPARERLIESVKSPYPAKSDSRDEATRDV